VLQDAFIKDLQWQLADKQPATQHSVRLLAFEQLAYFPRLLFHCLPPPIAAGYVISFALEKRWENESGGWGWGAGKCVTPLGNGRLVGKTFAVMSATGRSTSSKCFKYGYHFVFGCILHSAFSKLHPESCICLSLTHVRRTPGSQAGEQPSTRTTHVTAKVKSLPSMFAFQVSLLAGSSFCAAHRRP